MNEERPALHVAIFYWCVLAIEVVSFRLCWLEERIFVRIARLQRRLAARQRLEVRKTEAAKPQRRERKRPLQTL